MDKLNDIYNKIKFELDEQTKKEIVEDESTTKYDILREEINKKGIRISRSQAESIFKIVKEMIENPEKYCNRGKEEK